MDKDISVYYHRLFEHSLDAVFLVERKTGRLVDANKAAETLTGYPIDVLKQMRVSDIAPAGAGSRLKKTAERNDTLDHGEVGFVRPDGTQRTGLLSTVVVNEELHFGIAKDITDRKKIEQKLQWLTDHFTRAQSVAHIGSWVIDLAAGTMWASDEAFFIYGLPLTPKRQLPLGKVQSIPLAEDRPHLDLALKRLIEENVPYDIEFRIQRPDTGEVRYIHSRAELIRSSEGVPVRIAGTIQDVTDRVRTEEAMRSAQKMESIGIMAGGIAHDFNNLLQAILGQMQIAREQLPQGHRSIAHLDKAVRAAERAASLTQQLLAYAGRGRFDVKTIDFNLFLKEAVRIAEIALPKDAELALSFPQIPLWIRADTAQLQQMVMNLVMNAGEALNGRHGVITVRLSEEKNLQERASSWTHAPEGWEPGTCALLEIHDTGSGMDEATLQKVFDPFFTTKEKGRGLGLPAVLGIVRGHGGGIDLRSVPGDGTTFRIAFPTVPACEEGSAAVDQPTASGKRTLLIIDDEEFVLDVFKDYFSALGYQVLTAASGEEGITLYRAQCSAIGLIVLDLSMPGMGGEAAFGVLIGEFPDARIIISSGYAEDDVMKRFEGHHVTGFIQKPFQWKQVGELLGDLLRGGAQ